MIRLYDTWNKKEFEVDPVKPLKIYICGPTVYSHTHVGHLKTYMTFDIIRRVLEDHFKIPVQMMMNITNVDDKIIKATYQQEYKLSDDFDLKDLKSDKYLENQKFVDFADKWEKLFFDMMDRAYIKRPEILSRVTEYIDEILEFVEAIYDQGLAFAHEGSVYFYGTKFNNILEQDSTEYSKDPENPYNFVLLKKTRSYEPGWHSKWGSVRPGWHIECSAMASSVFGSNFDIHGGGVDLKFPHHHNEMQQSNARYHTGTHKQWVDHFMHTGHLNIDGLKMSKSLKNFITVEEIYAYYTPNELRMLFLLHQWADPMDYSEDTMNHAKYYNELFTNFFKQAQSILLRKTTVKHKKYGPEEIKQSNLLIELKSYVDTELRNNINTPKVIKKLQDSLTGFFVYVTTMEESKQEVSGQILLAYIDYVRSILSMLGLNYDSKSSGKEDQLIKVISDIRTDLRVIARDISKKIKPLDKQLSKELPQDLYKLTDKVRDEILPEIGIELTDK